MRPFPKKLLSFPGNAVLFGAAWCLRRVLTSTRYVAITGSVGKSTCTRCLEAILRNEVSINVTRGNRNGSPGVYQTVLRTRPRHRYSVVEIGINGPGQMARRASTVRPHLAIILAVAQVHRVNLRSLEMVREEKRTLLDALVPGGTAILSGEDEQVRGMRSSHAGKIVLFGNCENSVARATDIRSSLEEGLRFRVHTPKGGGDIEMRLFGVHWLPSVLGAIAASHELGVPLERVAESLREVSPMPARMDPVLLPSGAILIRDEHNGSFATAGPAIEFASGQSARRRFLIWSDFSDTSKSPRERMRWLLNSASGFDGLVFVGEHAPLAAEMAEKRGLSTACVHFFPGWSEASAVLPSILGDGDVALLRGRTYDHLERLVYAQFGNVKCTRADCRKPRVCDTCPLLDARTVSGELVKLTEWVPGIQRPVGAKWFTGP